MEGPVFGISEPTDYEKKFCYLKTITYRGIDVDLFSDDCEQQDYFYYKGRGYGCGSYNEFPEREVQFIIDRDLDYIHNLAEDDKRFFGAHIEYANHEHSLIKFSYRGEVIKIFETKDISIDDIKKECIDMLNKLFKNPEFIRMEEERKARGDLYFNEIVERESSK